MQKVKEFNGFSIYQRDIPVTLKSKFMSLFSNYVNRTEVLYPYQKGGWSLDEENNLVILKLNYKEKDYVLKVNCEDSCKKRFSLEPENEELYQSLFKAEIRYPISENFEAFFTHMFKRLDVDNQEYYETYSQDTPVYDDENEESEGYNSDDESPFDYFKDEENEKDVEKEQFFSDLRTKANELYLKEGFNPGNIGESFSNNRTFNQNLVINIILKDLAMLMQIENIEIKPINNNIFDLDVIFKTFENEKLNEQIKAHNIDGICMNIKVNMNYGPFFPPTIVFKYPKMKHNLDVGIMNISFFNIETWNPTNTLGLLVAGVYKILDEHCEIEDDQNMSEFTDITSCLDLLTKNNNLSISHCPFDIDIDHKPITTQEGEQTKSGFWEKGTGYGSSSSYKNHSDWSISKYVKVQELMVKMNIKHLETLTNTVQKHITNAKIYKYLGQTNIVKIIDFFSNQINLVEIEKNHQLYQHLINLIITIDFNQLVAIQGEEIIKLAQTFERIIHELKTFINLQRDSTYKDLITSIISIAEEFSKYIAFAEVTENDDIQKKYCEALKPLQFGTLDNKYKFHYKSQSLKNKPNKECIKRLSRELATYSVPNSLPLHYDSSVFLKHDQMNTQSIKMMIIGPKDTPYQNGCFFFDIHIPNNYPRSPPLVNLETTGNSSVRFNPNLYNNGKVCLSLLGTWRGSETEMWNEESSTLLQVIVSIQSLILIPEPYFNEPGYERNIGNATGKKNSSEYNDNIRYQTMVWAMNDILINTPPNFVEIVKTHFKLKREDIKTQLNYWESETKRRNENFGKIKNEFIQRLDAL